MQKTITLFFTLVCWISLANAQQASISGQVTDAQTNEPLYAATIQVGANGTFTLGDGTYSLDLEPGTHEVVVSYVGYKNTTEQIALRAGENLTLNIALLPEATLLNTATVTAGKHEKPLGEVTVSLEVLKPELIENTSKTSLDEVIEKVPGVTVIDGQANIRGGSGFSQGAGSRVLLLLDDIPILQADAGYPNWDDIPIENIEQIEVIKGASSALYGASALNGIINVRSAYPRSEPETKIATFSTLYLNPKDPRFKWWDSQPFGYASTVSHRRKIGKLDFVAGAFYINEDSYNKNTYEEYGRVHVKTNYRINDRLTIGFAGLFNKGRSGSFFYWASDTSAYVGSPTTINDRKRFRYSIDLPITYFDKSGNRHRILSRYYDVDNDNSNNQSNESQMWYAEYQFQRRLANTDLVVTAGLVASGSKGIAPLYGNTISKSRNLAGYAQVDKKFFNRLNLSAGFRYEDNLLENPGFTYPQGVVDPVNERESKPVFRFGANYRLLDYTYIRTSWGQGYRFPSVAEKFIVTNAGGFFVLPNPGLKSESGWSAELGIKQGFQIASFEGFLDVSGFLMKYSDMMEFNLAGTGFRSTNIGETEIKGFEVSVAGRGRILGQSFNLITGYYYIDPRFLDFDPTPIAPGEPGTIGQINANNSSLKTDNILKYRSKHNFKIDLETNISDFSIGLETFYNSKIEAIDAAFLLIVPGLANFRQNEDKGVLTFNVRTAYQISDTFKISFIAGNIFNSISASRPGLMDAPRNLTLRLDCHF
ncbi:MAG: TonB-dependent receptor [Saprospiraceae bacterium]|nr:TonB-dependent receptor [Saprospiraceae bacterium]